MYCWLLLLVFQRLVNSELINVVIKNDLIVILFFFPLAALKWLPIVLWLLWLSGFYFKTFRFLDEDENEVVLPVFRKFKPRWLILLFFSSIGCSVILIAGNRAFLLIEKCPNCYRFLELFWHNFLTKDDDIKFFPPKRRWFARAPCISNKNKFSAKKIGKLWMTYAKMTAS